MAHISHRLGPFTGQVGPVVFVHGEAETDDLDMLAYFAENPGLYDVAGADEPTDPPVIPDPEVLNALVDVLGDLIDPADPQE